MALWFSGTPAQGETHFSFADFELIHSQNSHSNDKIIVGIMVYHIAGAFRCLTIQHSKQLNQIIVKTGHYLWIFFFVLIWYLITEN